MAKVYVTAIFGLGRFPSAMSTDLLILTVYFICVGYVLYQMALSLEKRFEDQIAIHLDSDSLQTEVTGQIGQQGKTNRMTAEVVEAVNGLRSLVLSLWTSPQGEKPNGTVEIQVLPQGRKPLNPPLQALVVQVANRNPDVQIYIDWDRSSINRMQGQTERVIRQIPGMPLDLLQPQVFSVVNPEQALNATIFPESLFARNAENQTLEAKAALINFEQVIELPDKIPKTYSLRLLVWLKRTIEEDAQAMRLLIPFNFTMEVLPDEPAFFVLRWIFSR
ncbi:MAG: hypothetical protein AAF215_27230 [Cyanobacteria bacterium P01_A01_bin.123]